LIDIMKSRIIRMIAYMKKPSSIVRYFLIEYANYVKWIPDITYVKLLYWGHFGKKLSLNNYEHMSFNEKLQWLKLYDRNKFYTQLVDKHEFKEFIRKDYGDDFIVPTIGVWDTFKEIDFSNFPNQFVLKCTHDSTSVLICRDKELFDLKMAEKRFNQYLSRNLFWAGREWPYKNVKPRIIAEKYLEESAGDVSGLTDYKFHCFNGVPKFLYISKGLEDHSAAFMSFYDLKGDQLPFKRADYKDAPDKLKMPPCFNQMIKLSKKIAKRIESPFVRVDLLYINGQVYFSEVTFTPTSGLMPFEPERWDLILGKLLKI
jgi:hypothetical protein